MNCRISRISRVVAPVLPAAAVVGGPAPALDAEGPTARTDTLRVAGLRLSVEVLRGRWGARSISPVRP
jgi:hypothetical protein